MQLTAVLQAISVLLAVAPSYTVFRMSNLISLLDKARDLCAPPTDYQLAKQLGIAQTTLSRVRKRGGTLEIAAIYKLAAMLEQDAKTITALTQLDVETRPAVREFWERLAPRVVPSLVIGLLAAAGWIFFRGLSHPSHYFETLGFVIFNPLYIMRSVIAVLLAVVVVRAFTAPARNPVTANADP